MPEPLPGSLAAMFPQGRAAADPRYADGKGHAVVRYAIALPPGAHRTHLKIVARLYYQSFAPYFSIAHERERPGSAASSALSQPPPRRHAACRMASPSRRGPLRQAASAVLGDFADTAAWRASLSANPRRIADQELSA